MDLEQFEEKAKGLGVLGVKVTQHGREIAYKNWDRGMPQEHLFRQQKCHLLRCGLCHTGRLAFFVRTVGRRVSRRPAGTH